jgi:hypothetical protein
MSNEKQLYKLGSGNYYPWSFKMKNLLVKEGTWYTISEEKKEGDEKFDDDSGKAFATIALNMEDAL